ncbi:hypothetical protein ANACOL_02387 [Anaerotruncus colihominis DSM 17241]|uniref:Uncharacterized protein n=1 Tax=Anaerotruncus colihominis DSM 17241 TaxID=445972 RepID=B0PC79_9FIRM|nr:hypothetical protein ANACOL_02387 [Anaerotruncus colihominis DSM 17241]
MKVCHLNPSFLCYISDLLIKGVLGPVFSAEGRWTGKWRSRSGKILRGAKAKE